MADTIRSQLAILEAEDQWRYPKWREAARFFRRRARSGKDISVAEAALRAVYRECDDVTVMEPIADALMYQRLKRGDEEGLGELLRDQELRDDVVDAILRAVERREKVDRAIPVLVDLVARGVSGLDFMSIRNVFTDWVARKPARLGPLVEQMSRTRRTRAHLKSMLFDISFSDVPLGAAAPHLVRCLEDEPLRDEIVWILEGSTEQTPLGALAEQLEPYLADRKTSVRRTIASILARDRRYRRDWPGVDELLAYRNAAVRAGAVTAMSTGGKRRPGAHAQARVLRALTDRAVTVRRTATRVIARYREARLEPRAARREVESLLPALGRETGEALAEGLAWLLEADPDQAGWIGQALSTMRGRSAKAARRVRSICDRLTTDTAATVACTLCERLERSICKNSACALPPERERLEPVPEEHYRFPLPVYVDRDADDYEQQLLRCPECGTYYARGYSCEYDVNSQFEVHVYQRLSPTGALAVLRGEARAAHERALARLHAGFEQDLQHPHDRRRAEAAWALAELALAEESIDRLRALLTHEASSVRQSAISALSASPRCADLVAELADTLRTLSRDRTEEIRVTAARLTRDLLVAQGDLETLRRQCTSDEPEERLAGIAGLGMAAEKGADLTEDLPALLAFLSHKQERMRRAARAALLALVKAAPGHLEQVVGHAAGLLGGRRQAPARAAAELLDWIADQGQRIDPALPALGAALLRQHTRFHAFEAIKGAARGREDVSPLVPLLIPAIQAGTKTEEYCWALHTWMDGGGDVSAAAPVLPLALKSREPSAAAEIFRGLARRGVDLSGIAEQIERRMPSLEPYIVEYLADGLTLHYLSRADWQGLRRLLDHSHYHVPAMATYTLTDHAAKLDPCLLPSLVRNLGHGREFVRDASLRLLSARVRSDREGVRAALKGLRSRSDQAQALRALV